VKEYYDTRAPEYDEWYMGLGRFEDIDRPGWDAAVTELERMVAQLPPARTLDVACGTGFLTRHLRGALTGLDQSEQMLAVARTRLPCAALVCGDALSLPFPADSFQRLLTGHFYGHLEPEDRRRFIAEARRVAPELVVIDSALRPGHRAEERQERVLNDGSRFEVYKRYFDAYGLAQELGAGTILLENQYFVAVAHDARSHNAEPTVRSHRSLH